MIYKYRLNQLEDRIPYELHSILTEQAWTYLVKSVGEEQRHASHVGLIYMGVSICFIVTIPLSCWFRSYGYRTFISERMQVVCDNLNTMYYMGRQVFLWEPEYHLIAIDCDTLVLDEDAVHVNNPEVKLSNPVSKKLEDIVLSSQSIAVEDKAIIHNVAIRTTNTPYSAISTSGKDTLDADEDIAAAYYRET